MIHKKSTAFVRTSLNSRICAPVFLMLLYTQRQHAVGSLHVCAALAGQEPQVAAALAQPTVLPSAIAEIMRVCELFLICPLVTGCVGK